MDIADQFIDLEANVAQFARADLPPRPIYPRPESGAMAPRPATAYTPRAPYGTSVRGYGNTGYTTTQGEGERPTTNGESTALTATTTEGDDEEYTTPQPGQ